MRDEGGVLALPTGIGPRNGDGDGLAGRSGLVGDGVGRGEGGGASGHGSLGRASAGCQTCAVIGIGFEIFHQPLSQEAGFCALLAERAARNQGPLQLGQSQKRPCDEHHHDQHFDQAEP
jgi:hypothetical protein